MATRLRGVGIRNREKIREKNARTQRVAFQCVAHVEVGRRASRALRNTHEVGEELGRVSAAFGAKIF